MADRGNCWGRDFGGHAVVTGGSRKWIAGYLLTLLAFMVPLLDSTYYPHWLGFLVFLWGGIMGIDQRKKEAMNVTNRNATSD